MTPSQSKVSAVLLSLFALSAKQFAVHGKLDPIALGDWVVQNWDVLFAGLVVGWTFLRSRWLVKEPAP